MRVPDSILDGLVVIAVVALLAAVSEDSDAGRRWGVIFLTSGGLAGAVGAWNLVTRDRLKPGCCARCGYDLRATPARCPECGTRQD